MGIIKTFGTDFVGGGSGGASQPSLLHVIVYSGNNLTYLGGNKEGVEMLTAAPTACDNNFASGGDWETPSDVLSLDPLPALPEGFCIVQNASNGTLSFMVNYKAGINYDFEVGSYVLIGPNDKITCEVSGTSPTEEKTFKVLFGSVL